MNEAVRMYHQVEDSHEPLRSTMRPYSINHVVAILGAVLAISSYCVLKEYGMPDRICVGGGILAALVVAIFWSSVCLGTEDDDE